MERRAFLRGLGAIGCSAAAQPWLGRLALAGAPDGRLGQNRLVVAILRGAMDGLDVVQPLADPLFARLRPSLGAGTGTHGLDDRFALHAALGGLMPLWQRGELGFVHATSTPYRDKRSHFDGQDLLEAGVPMEGPGTGARHEGWLNRMLQAVPGLTAETAFAVGRDALPLLSGRAPSLSWTPDQRLPLSAQGQLLLEHVYHDDPLFREAGAEAMLLGTETEARLAAAAADEGEETAGGPMMMGGGMEPPAAPAPARFGDVDALVGFAAGKLRGDTRIAAFSLGGWDTHRAQAGAIAGPLLRLERIILQLQAGLGAEVWGQTLFLALTEFGRTVRENGSRGTDHGTAGVAVLAGGALRGGRVLGNWPGLDEADLYDRRDLMPTSDVRSWAAWGLRGLYGFDRTVLETAVFPGLDMGLADPRLLR